MQRFRGFVLTGYYLLLVTFPLVAFGQGAGLPRQIVPCAGATAGVGATGPLPACRCSHLIDLAQNIINTGIFIFIIFAAVMFAYAGFLYLTNEALGKQQQAREIFKNVAIGLAVILSAWLLVDTIMNSMLGGSFGDWNAGGGVDAACRAIGLE